MKNVVLRILVRNNFNYVRVELRSCFDNTHNKNLL